MYAWRPISHLYSFINVYTSSHTCEWAKLLEKMSVKIRSSWLAVLPCKSIVLETEMQLLWGQTTVGQGSFDCAKALVLVWCLGNGSCHLKMTCCCLSSVSICLNKWQFGREGTSPFNSCTGCHCLPQVYRSDGDCGFCEMENLPTTSSPRVVLVP